MPKSKARYIIRMHLNGPLRSGQCANGFVEKVKAWYFIARYDHPPTIFAEMAHTWKSKKAARDYLKKNNYLFSQLATGEVVIELK